MEGGARLYRVSRVQGGGITRHLMDIITMDRLLGLRLRMGVVTRMELPLRVVRELEGTQIGYNSLPL